MGSLGGRSLRVQSSYGRSLPDEDQFDLGIDSVPPIEEARRGATAASPRSQSFGAQPGGRWPNGVRRRHFVGDFACAGVRGSGRKMENQHRAVAAAFRPAHQPGPSDTIRLQGSPIGQKRTGGHQLAGLRPDDPRIARSANIASKNDRSQSGNHGRVES